MGARTSALAPNAGGDFGAGGAGGAVFKASRSAKSIAGDDGAGGRAAGGCGNVGCGNVADSSGKAGADAAFGRCAGNGAGGGLGGAASERSSGTCPSSSHSAMPSRQTKVV